MAENLNILMVDGPDFIPLESDGGTLVVIGGILITEEAVAEFTSLPPVGGTVGGVEGQGAFNKRLKGELRQA